MEYGQFCPIAKTAEIIGEKWTILIIREILMGSSRFNELQRGLSLISPAVLSKRLTTLADYELILKRKIPGQRGYEYLPTESCKELLPILVSIGNWGMRWTRKNLNVVDYDVGLLMLYLQRSVNPEKLIGDETAIRFHFNDLDKVPNWWLIVKDDEVDVCTTDPGRDVDVYFTTTVEVMTKIWMGEITYRKAISGNVLTIFGPRALTNNVTSWMSNCQLFELPPAADI
jgi:DNA-binding HxlR family transcriptional regulator